MQPLRVLTWHVHGTYLYYLTHAKAEFYLPVRPDRGEGYGGRPGGFPPRGNVHEIPAEHVRDLPLDVILFQSRKNYERDQYDILSDEQRELPRIYLEHDPPRESPTETRHPVDDPDILLVHCTHFNALMWDSGRTPTRVIEHGVVVPDDLRYTGALQRGLVVVNNLRTRGRRLGADIFQRVRKEVPLDLVGIGAEELGGIPSLGYGDLQTLEVQHRFFLNPIRYTSLGLAVCEAMMLGMPVVGLATTEMATVIENGFSGYVDTNVDTLIERMQELLRDWEKAQRLGENARRYAQERFNIGRFARDWEQALEWVAATNKDRINESKEYVADAR